MLVKVPGAGVADAVRVMGRGQSMHAASGKMGTRSKRTVNGPRRNAWPC